LPWVCHPIDKDPSTGIPKAGWRRDEWAYSPLFIWCGFLPENSRAIYRELI